MSTNVTNEQFGPPNDEDIRNTSFEGYDGWRNDNNFRNIQEYSSDSHFIDDVSIITRRDNLSVLSLTILKTRWIYHILNFFILV